MAGLLIFLMYARAAAARPMNVGRAKVKNQSDDSRKATFADVAGADEEKEELQEIVEFLKNPGKFNALGARIPTACCWWALRAPVKLCWPGPVPAKPACRSTPSPAPTLWRCMWAWAPPACATCLTRPRSSAPCIIFIDEIDAVGRQRGAGLGGGHDEREQTLNQLLVEMDGFGANEGVIVIAATNRADILDPALLRPGPVRPPDYVGLPDVKGREEILKVHARNKPLAPDVDLPPLPNPPPALPAPIWKTWSTRRPCLAARAAARPSPWRRSRRPASRWSPAPRKRAAWSPSKEKRLTAYHEAGHAIATYYCPTARPGAPDLHHPPRHGGRLYHEPARGGQELHHQAGR